MDTLEGLPFHFWFLFFVGIVSCLLYTPCMLYGAAVSVPFSPSISFLFIQKKIKNVGLKSNVNNVLWLLVHFFFF